MCSAAHHQHDAPLTCRFQLIRGRVLHGSLEAVAAAAAAASAAAAGAAAALVLAHVGGAAHVGAVSAPVAGLPALEAGVAAAAAGGSIACIAVRGRRLEAAAAIAAACKCTSGAHMRCMGRWAEPAEGMPCMEKTLNRQLRMQVVCWRPRTPAG